MVFLQELFNANDENLREILEEGWLLDWVERARDEIRPWCKFHPSILSSEAIHSVFFFSLASPGNPAAHPGHEGHLHHPPRLPPAGGRVKRHRPSKLNVSGSWQEEEASHGGSSVPGHRPGFLLFPTSSNLVTVAQVMIGAMDNQKRFFAQPFLQLRASLDYIISHF